MGRLNLLWSRVITDIRGILWLHESCLSAVAYDPAGPVCFSAGRCIALYDDHTTSASKMAKSGTDQNYIRKQAFPTTELHVGYGC